MITWNCSTDSTASGIPARPAASSFADTPSTMKLLERLRWLATDSPLPGTAEVSAKSCVLGMLVGETPGTSSARSRKLRPFIGSALASVACTVPAIWLRAVSSAGDSSVTVTVSSPPTASAIGSWNAEPAFSDSGRLTLRNPCLATTSS